MKLTMQIELDDNATHTEIENAFLHAAGQAWSALDEQGSMNPGQSYLLAIGKSFPKLKSAILSRLASLNWRVREHRVGNDGPLLGCFVEAPAEGDMPYALEVLGDDYTGYGGIERKYEHCQMIVAWANRGE